MRPLEKKKNSYYENIPFCKLLLNFYERKKMFCAFWDLLILAAEGALHLTVCFD